MKLKWFSLEIKSRNYDLIAAVIGLIIGTAVISAHFLRMQHEYLITLGSVLVAACLFYLLFRKRLLRADDAAYPAKETRSHILIINIIFFLVFAASIYTLQTAVLPRPISYFLLTSVACAVVAVEIVLCSVNRPSTYSILGKIFLVALSLRCSEYFGFAGIVGIDPWAHYGIIRDLLSQGHMQQIQSSSGAINACFNYPLMHLYTGMMSSIGVPSIKDAMFLAAALPEVLSTVFVFLLGREIIGAKGALYATLIMNFSNFHIQFGTQIVAMTFGVALVSLAVYLVMSRQGWSRASTMRLMTLLLFAVIIFTHTVTTFVLFIILLALFIMARLYKILDRVDIPVKYGSGMLLLLFTVGMLSKWMFTAYKTGPFLNYVLIGLYSSVTGSAALLDRPQVASDLATPFYESVLNISGFAILFGLGAIGSLMWLSNRYKSVDRVSMIGMVILLFMVPFSFSLFGIRNVMPYRWFVFMYIPLTIVASFAIVQILALWNRASLKILGIAIITLVLSFFMITSTTSNTDSPIYKKGTTQRLLFTAQEMSAAESITGVYDGRIIYDGNYWGPFIYYYKCRGKVSHLQESWIEGQLPGGIFIWREHMDKRPIYVGGEGIKSYTFVTLEEGYEKQLGMERHLIYSNSQVKAYLSR